MRRKILCLVLALSMTLSMTGCGALDKVTGLFNKDNTEDFVDTDSEVVDDSLTQTEQRLDFIMPVGSQVVVGKEYLIRDIVTPKAEVTNEIIEMVIVDEAQQVFATLIPKTVGEQTYTIIVKFDDGIATETLWSCEGIEDTEGLPESIMEDLNSDNAITILESVNVKGEASTPFTLLSTDDSTLQYHYGTTDYDIVITELGAAGTNDYYINTAAIPYLSGVYQALLEDSFNITDIQQEIQLLATYGMYKDSSMKMERRATEHVIYDVDGNIYPVEEVVVTADMDKIAGVYKGDIAFTTGLIVNYNGMEYYITLAGDYIVPTNETKAETIDFTGITLPTVDTKTEEDIAIEEENQKLFDSIDIDMSSDDSLFTNLYYTLKELDKMYDIVSTKGYMNTQCQTTINEINEIIGEESMFNLINTKLVAPLQLSAAYEDFGIYKNKIIIGDARSLIATEESPAPEATEEDLTDAENITPQYSSIHKEVYLWPASDVKYRRWYYLIDESTSYVGSIINKDGTIISGDGILSTLTGLIEGSSSTGNKDNDVIGQDSNVDDNNVETVNLVSAYSKFELSNEDNKDIQFLSGGSSSSKQVIKYMGSEYYIMTASTSDIVKYQTNSLYPTSGWKDNKFVVASDSSDVELTSIGKITPYNIKYTQSSNDQDVTKGYMAVYNIDNDYLVIYSNDIKDNTKTLVSILETVVK